MMDREQMVEEISLRVGIPEEEVADVLEEQDIIFIEEEKKLKKKKAVCACLVVVTLTVAIAAIFRYLIKQEKIKVSEVEALVKENVKKYTDIIRAKVDEYR